MRGSETVVVWRFFFWGYYTIMDYLYHLLQMSMNKKGNLSVEHRASQNQRPHSLCKLGKQAVKMHNWTSMTGLALHITTDTLHFVARATLHHFAITVFASNLPWVPGKQYHLLCSKNLKSSSSTLTPGFTCLFLSSLRPDRLAICSKQESQRKSLLCHS